MQYENRGFRGGRGGEFQVTKDGSQADGETMKLSLLSSLSYRNSWNITWCHNCLPLAAMSVAKRPLNQPRGIVDTETVHRCICVKKVSGEICSSRSELLLSSREKLKSSEKQNCLNDEGINASNYP